ncbi:Glutamate--tRNA ligase mitochondrial [Lignoscripta atroalba]|nr:Glutamate--tRNA ligase mitochondrial [Lignoscripta atroalba]
MFSLLSRPTGKSKGWICSTCRGLSTAPPLGSQQQSVPIRRSVSRRLPDYPTRTRFAPSPTGYLHLGSLRTALFNYLLAKATGGQFLLRIEDTDKKRTVAGAEDRICRDLEWAGLHWDEGPEVGGPYGPYRQSDRTALYREHAHKLLDSGHAYRCFCTSDRLDKLAKQRSQLGLPTDYDRTCEGLPEAESQDRAFRGETYVIRLKVPDIYPKYDDLVYGSIGRHKQNAILFKHGEPAYEDPILIKSDGSPTYHLANVVDDHHMEITHVIRAVEWMPSTPKHLIIYDAFGWQPPVFAHVGLLQDENGQKLSKRNLDIDIQSFEKDGIFPEALVNYVSLLGWSHSLGTDLLPSKPLIENFDLKFTKGNTVVSFGKLNYLQKRYAKIYAEEGGAKFQEMIDRVLAIVEEARRGRTDLDVADDLDFREYVAAVLRLDAKQYTSPEAFVSRNRFFFLPLWETGSRFAQSEQTRDHNKQEDGAIASAARKFADIPPSRWTTTSLREKTIAIVDEICKMRYTWNCADSEEPKGPRDSREANKVFNHWLRQAIMGGLPGPSMPDTMALLGRDVTLSRLHRGARFVTEPAGMAH